MKLAALVLGAGAAAGCVTPSLAEAERATAAGAHERAELILRQHAAKHPEDAALQARWHDARAQAAAASFTAIDPLVEAGDLDAAERAAEVPVYLEPDSEAYRAKFAAVRLLRRDIRERIRAADEAGAAGDWLRARRLIEPVRKFQVTFEALGPLWDRIALANHAIALREGERHLVLRDYAGAAGWFADAVALRPGEPTALARQQVATDWQRARALAHEAEALTGTGALPEAVAKAREAAQLHAESRHVQAVLREAVRLAHRDHLARSTEAERAGDLRTALRWALRLRELDAPQQALREEAAARWTVLTGLAAARYLAAGIAEERRGRYGAAWCYYRVARALRPKFPGLPARLSATAEQLAARTTYRVLVMPLDARGWVVPGGGGLLADGVRAAIGATFGGRVQALGPADCAGGRVRATGLPPDAVIRGATDRLWVATPDPEIRRAPVDYVAGQVPALNDRVEQLKAAWDDAQARVPEAERLVPPAQRDYERYRADHDRAVAERDRIGARRTSDPREQVRNSNDWQAASGRVQSAALVMNIALLALETAKAGVRQRQDQAEQLMQAYMAEEPYVMVPLRARYVAETAVVHTTVSARASVTLKDFAGETVSEPVRVEDAFTLSDGVRVAFPEAGVEADPYAIASDRELLGRMAQRVGEAVVRGLHDRLAANATGLLARAAREATRGDRAGELHYLALALHARHALPEERAAALPVALAARTGLAADGSTIDVSKIPVEPLQR